MSASKRCSDLSRAVGEPLAATAPTADRWLLLEVPGTWSRDVGTGGTLPARAQEAVVAWLGRTPRSRLHFLRRPGRPPERLSAFVVRAEEAVSEVRRLELAALDDLASVDFEKEGEPVEAQLVLVCGHGSRDACCALRGTAVYGALAGHVDEGDLWLSSHQGGHRFAANVLLLPSGIQLGRVDPEDTVSLTAHALEGRIELDHYRGRTCYDPPVQAAEHAIRRARRLEQLVDLRLASVEDSVVRFRDRRGNEHEATVLETEGPVTPASCGAQAETQRVLEARLV
jgi:hypothetical protein